jgi:hypothetical protein
MFKSDYFLYYNRQEVFKFTSFITHYFYQLCSGSVVASPK